MAVLSAAERDKVTAQFMEELSGERGHAVPFKAETRAMIDALDDYFNAHQAEINAAIPIPARNVYSTANKARAGTRVLNARYVNGV
jgi:nucleoid-associated protein YejK